MTDVLPTYLDRSGRPQLRPSIVGFLDLLGFSHQVQAAAGTEESQRLLDKIVDAIADSRQFVRRQLTDDFDGNPDCWAIKFFSDNLVLGYPHDDSTASLTSAAWFVIRCVQRYQLRMALNGLLLRGGLTSGPVCMTDEIIYGSALIDCYQLESHVSIVPRVILSEKLGEVVASSFQYARTQPMPEIGESICRDVDGWWFVNYLEAARRGNEIDWDAIERHKQGVLQSVSGTTRHDVLPKYGWACRYHNMFCHWHRDEPGFQDRFHIDRDDERSTIYRLREVPQSGKQP